MRRRLGGSVLAWLMAVAGVLAPGDASAQTGFRYVNATDPTCGGQSPCYATIQAAVNAALPGEHVVVQAGTYHEQIDVTGKNNTPSASEADRLVIEADPAAAPGAVVLQGAVTQCTNGHGVKFQQSKFVTLRGLTITGAGGAAVALMGGNNQNAAIHLERLRLVGNGSSSCDGGITIARGNPDTLLVNSLIHANGRNGIATIDADGGPHWIIGNTIHGNAWSGVSITHTHVTYLVNNLITGNGTAAGSTGGRFGVARESSTNPQPTGITLLNNLICGNRLGEINGPALDATDANNLTPTGAEGPGVSASPGCDATASVYDHLVGADGVAGTLDDDFRLATGSLALDRGMDPRTLGLPSGFTALFETDFTGVAGARPRNATGAPSALFDPGAFEANPPDTTAPAVTFQLPDPAGAYVRGTIAVRATATDGGSGVATFPLDADSQSLTATLTPTLPPPAPSVIADAAWNTIGVADGTHTLTATATDAAGNPATATRVVLVDNTPPETSIDSGPSGEIGVASATFTFSGTDNLTPVGSLVFAWRLDGGAWSAFSGTTSAALTDLGEGAHTFEVKARDLAGNEDPTPAAQTFTVRFGPSITDVTPTTGTIGTYVTITGTNFEPGATSVTFNGLAAVIRTLSASQITTTVPIGAATGPLVVTTSRGSASATFTVTLTGDFTITASPATVRAIAGDQGSAHIVVTGGGSFTSLVAPSVAPAAPGVTATFGAPFIAPGASTPLTFRVDAGVAAGTYDFTVTGTSSIDGRTITHTAPVSLEVLSPDTHAVTGRIMTAESIPLPIPGVSVALGSAFVLTDAAGNFVLLAPPTGPNMLFVDGRTASVVDAQFPIVEVQISVAASGPTRVPFTIYLPKLDTGNAITLPLDAAGFTTQEVKATTPRIPGLEITVPAGTRIVGPDGNPVGQLVITPVPLDRSPMPFPPGTAFPLLFALNPGGSVPSNPLPIAFPNTNEAPPGTTADLYYFDLAIGNWNIWGTGTVSADGKQVVSDPGYGLPRLAWHSYCDGARCLASDAGAPPANNKPGKKAGDPVDLFTGRLNVTKTDVVLPARIPLRIQRSYWSGLTRVGLFGLGWNLEPYDLKLVGRGTALTLVQGDQAELVFVPDGPGRWINLAAPYMAGAVITPLPGEYSFQLRLKDGTLQRFDRIVGFSNVAGLTAITDRTGNTVTITRVGSSPTSFGQITQITEPAGRAIILAYDAAGRIQTITDPLNRTVQYTYDAQGRLETVTDQAGGVTRYAYDASHRITSITDPRGITYLTNEYDSANRVARQTQADGGVWQFDYATQGNAVFQTTATDPRGNPTIHRFTSQGFSVSTTDALGQTTTFEYAPTSNLLTATTDPLGRVTRFAYDAQGNVSSITDPAGTVRGFTYEPTFNKVTTASNPLTPPTQFGYDAQGNLTTITDPLGKITTLTYNAFGQAVTISDPLGQTTTFTYDAAGNLASVADPLGNTTRFDYDAAGRRLRSTDPLGKVADFGFDPLNRITTIVDALGGLTRFAFDPNGNLLTVTDARGNTTGHTYDAMDHLATRTDPLGATETMLYDGAGNLAQRTDRKGQVSTFVYDALNRLSLATYADASATFIYDAAGRLVRADDSSGGTLTNAYDALDRVIAESTPAGSVAYQYDVLGRRTQFAAPGVAPTTYGYDAASRLQQIAQGPQLVTLDYDDAGRRTLLTLPTSVTTDYQYDLASRLTGLTYRQAAATLGNLTYAYDAAGNRVEIGGSFARTGLPEPAATATYDAANRQRAFGTADMTFDANGNLVSLVEPAGTTAFIWDARDRLVEVEAPGTLASFGYLLGRRTRKVINGAATDFLHDGLDVSQQVAAGTATTYLHTLSLDESIGATSSDGFFASIHDALGSTVAVVDGAGIPVASYTYEAFGATGINGGDASNPFQFTGRENDEIASLYYYRTRYYRPSFARFISEDSLLGPRNLYAYVRNNALRYVDPWGAAEIRAFGHTINVFGSLTLGPINLQADLNQVNVNFVVVPSFNLGADFLIDVPADAAILQVGPHRNLALGTGLVKAEEGCTLCVGGVQAQGVAISVSPFIVPVAPLPVFLTVPITTISADPTRTPPPVIVPSIPLPTVSASGDPTILGKRK